jgi:hypothetical protein
VEGNDRPNSTDARMATGKGNIAAGTVHLQRYRRADPDTMCLYGMMLKPNMYQEASSHRTEEEGKPTTKGTPSSTET